MLNILPYPIKGDTQYPSAQSKLGGKRPNKNLLLNAPLSFRKFQKVNGAGGEILVVSGGGEWDISPEITKKKRAVSQGFLAEGPPRLGEQVDVV